MGILVYRRLALTSHSSQCSSLDWMVKHVGCTHTLKHLGYGALNMLSFAGAIVLAIGFAILVYNIYYSTRYASRNIGSDPWNARTLEWATQSPVPIV